MKKTCSEPNCIKMRNIIADAYEISAAALEEIIKLEDAPNSLEKAISIAGNARRAALYHIHDSVNMINWENKTDEHTYPN